MQNMESIHKIEALLKEVKAHLEAPNKSKSRATAHKLHRIAKIASILAFTIYQLP